MSNELSGAPRTIELIFPTWVDQSSNDDWSEAQSINHLDLMKFPVVDRLYLETAFDQVEFRRVLIDALLTTHPTDNISSAAYLSIVALRCKCLRSGSVCR